jgi:2-C-methyl-D-erythritol 4-phosphate cytidylyltransferase
MVHVTWALVIACGKSEQLTPEVSIPFLNLNGKPVLSYSLQVLDHCPDIEGIVVVTDKERVDNVIGMGQMFGFNKIRQVVAGSATRHGSVQSGIKALEEEVTLVCVHEAGRPFVTSAQISDAVKCAKKNGTGILATEILDAVKEIGKGMLVSQSLEAGKYWTVHTPYVIAKDILVKIYEQASKKKTVIEDETVALENAKEAIHLVESKGLGFKIRSADDLTFATALLKL